METKAICIGAAGNSTPPGVYQSAKVFSFFDLKGDIETLVRRFQFRELAYNGEAAKYYRREHCARVLIDGQPVAQFGQIAPDIASSRKLRQDVFVGEIYLDRLYRHELRQPRYDPLPRYPAVERDFSFVFDDAITFAKIQGGIGDLGLKDLRSFSPAEIFRGGSIPNGKYSHVVTREIPIQGKNVA